jgi:putative ABC transport system substrate-binding protein
MSYGPNFPDLFRRAADDADKILRGTKPGDMHMHQRVNDTTPRRKARVTG